MSKVQLVTAQLDPLKIEKALQKILALKRIDLETFKKESDEGIYPLPSLMHRIDELDSIFRLIKENIWRVKGGE